MSAESIEEGARAGPFRGLGHRFEIATHDPELTDALAALYAPLRAPGELGGRCSEYRIEPPVPGQLWQLRVDGQVTVRSSTAGGAVRMLLRSVGEGIRRGAAAEAGLGERGVLRLDGAAVEVDGTGVLLLADRELDLTAVLVWLLDGHPDEVGYLGEAGVLVDVDASLVRSAPLPLALREAHWGAAAHLRELVPAGLVPYLDLMWPLPAAALGRVVDRAALAVVLHLGVGPPAGGGDVGSPADPPLPPVLQPLSPAVAATRLLDRLPAAERGGLTVDRLREVAALVERVDSYQLVAGPSPAELAAAVLTSVRARTDRPTTALAPG